MKKHFKIITVCALLVLYSLAVSYINRQYPPSEVRIQNSENAILPNGLILSSADIHFLSDDEIIADENIMNIIGIKQKDDVSDFKVMVVDIAVSNYDDTDINFNLTAVAFEINTYTNYVFMPLFEYINDESMLLTLNAEETKYISLPILLYINSFENRTFETLDDNKVNMVFSLYPIKEIITIGM